MPRSLSRLLHVVAGLAALLSAGPAAAFSTEEAKTPMRVTLVRSDLEGCGVDCPEWLALTGRIGFETPALLSAALARLKGRKIPVLLDSPGGESTAGLAMGRMLRAAKLDAVVATTVLTDCRTGDAACLSRSRAGVHPGHVGAYVPPACASACVFVLAGGVKRVVPYDAYVGVHQALRVLTFHPVMNTFRVLKRRIGDRIVEVSRTLVASRALPTRVVKGAAPASMYSTFDRFLLGMGIGEAIMPLMRATPPSGIHWLSRTEMIETRIVTDANDGTTFVRQAADDIAAAVAATAARRTNQAEAAALRPVQAPAALTLDDGRRRTGVVTWRIDATSRDVPVLIGDWHVPESHLGGSVTILPETAAGAASSFTVSARFPSTPASDAGAIFNTRPPQICDMSLCMPDLGAGPLQEGPVALFQVIRNWRGDFLMQLHKRDWLVFDVQTGDGRGRLALTLTSLDNHAIDLWEKLCCGFVAFDDPWTPPRTLLPALPSPRQPFLVSGFGPVTPLARSVGPTVGQHEAVALYEAQPTGIAGEPGRINGSVVWTPLAATGEPRRPDAPVLLGEVDLPDVKLHLRLRVGPSAMGTLGRLTAEIRATFPDEALFGPPGRLTVMTISDRRGHPLLLADSVFGFRCEGGYRIAFDIPEAGPVAGALQLAFEDEQQRRITVAIPIDPATAALLQAAARGDDLAGT